jgi:hypothetical protein
MKRSPFNNLKIYRYFFIAFILILAILAIYVSCKSKSPTDANAASNDALAAQGAQNTTQTTTSSSTTTSVKPGQSPTNTTTLITSRTLTSTSTRTTTTSSSTTSTTTTSRKTTTTIPTTVPTTSVGACDLEWCEVTVTINDGPPITFQEYGGTYTVSPGDQVKISISIKNSGTANSINSHGIARYFGNPPLSFIDVDHYEYLGKIPANNKCYTWPNALQINVSGSASPGDYCAITIMIQSDNCSLISATFGISIPD